MSFRIPTSGDRSITYEVTTAGSGIYTVPGAPNWAYKCYYTLIGGGGGGGGSETFSSSAAGGGGGGGEIVKGVFSILSSDTIAYTVGAGGTGGASSTNGDDGEDSSITPLNQAQITAIKGEGGGAQIGTTGGNGGNGGYGGGGGGSQNPLGEGAGGNGLIPEYNGANGSISVGGQGGGGGGLGGTFGPGGGGGGGPGGGAGGNGTNLAGSNAVGFGGGGGGAGGNITTNDSPGGNGGGGYLRLVFVRTTPPVPVPPIIYTVDNSIPSGTLTFTVPLTAISMTVEMIGAGGTNGGISGTPGNGGYISGSITNLSSLLGQTITLQAGRCSSTDVTLSSSATYISVVSGGPLIAVAGSGGNCGKPTGLTVVGPMGQGNGGQGGGGNFLNITSTTLYSIGTFGDDGYYPNTPGGNAATNTGGAGGVYTQAPHFTAGISGVNGSNPSGFTSVLGGNGELYTDPTDPFTSYGYSSAGGGGYAGGGGGAFSYETGPSNYIGYFGGGGGGSSYIDTNYLNLGVSYRGDDVPPGTLPGYGQANQNGYITVTIITSS